jgi:hypothetical protein
MSICALFLTRLRTADLSGDSLAQAGLQPVLLYSSILKAGITGPACFLPVLAWPPQLLGFEIESPGGFGCSRTQHIPDWR